MKVHHIFCPMICISIFIVWAAKNVIWYQINSLQCKDMQEWSCGKLLKEIKPKKKLNQICKISGDSSGSCIKESTLGSKPGVKRSSVSDQFHPEVGKLEGWAEKTTESKPLVLLMGCCEDRAVFLSADQESATETELGIKTLSWATALLWSSYN